VGRWCEELAALSPRYLEITKVSSNLWWNSARDNFASGVGMLVQAIGSPDMVEGATAFLEKRPARFQLDPGELPRGAAQTRRTH
jgi:2-ketocyclohexanecarboxyl-CoA hydrolase